MEQNQYIGIDYGRGQTNIDTATRIRYGVISQGTIMPEAFDSFEANYGEPSCAHCGHAVLDSTEASDETEMEARFDQEWFTGKDYYCPQCKVCLWADDVFPDEPLGWTLDDGEYLAEDCLQSDIIITRSPYYTLAPFCSPCVPGAGNLDSAGRGVKTYCFGHDWFEGGKAPYPVFRVSDDTNVPAEDK